MSWEYRGKQGPYYTRTRKVNGRTVREYIGAGLPGRLAAAGCDDQVTWAFGADAVSRIALITGSGCSVLDEAIALEGFEPSS
mgnify:CR=1 FL=1